MLSFTKTFLIGIDIEMVNSCAKFYLLIKNLMLHFTEISDVTLTTQNILHTGSEIIKGNQKTPTN